jgi:rhamnose transport system permease protein
MSDRVLVMRERRIAAELTRQQATQETVMAAATGTGAWGVGPGAGGVDPSHSKRSTPHASRPTGLPRLLSHFREIGIFIFVLLTFAVVSFFEPRFYSPLNLRTIAMSVPLILIIAMGQLMVIVSRNIDLSVGSVLGMSAIVAGGMFVNHPDMPVALGAAVAIFVGALLGLFNGTFIAWLRVPAIIVTLGTLSAYRGLIFIWSGGRQVDRNRLPQALSDLSTTGPLGTAWIIWIALAVTLAAGLFLRYARTGREIFAIGSNPPAARLRGIAVDRVLMIIFTITGALSGLAGFLFVSRFGTVNSGSVGRSMELDVISAVVIGGASVNGGSGTVLGTLLGCLLLGIVSVALTMLRVNEFWQMALYGAAIIVACLADAAVRRKTGGAA